MVSLAGITCCRQPVKSKSPRQISRCRIVDLESNAGSITRRSTPNCAIPTNIRPPIIGINRRFDGEIERHARAEFVRPVAVVKADAVQVGLSWAKRSAAGLRRCGRRGGRGRATARLGRRRAVCDCHGQRARAVAGRPPARAVICGSWADTSRNSSGISISSETRSRA